MKIKLYIKTIGWTIFLFVGLANCSIKEKSIKATNSSDHVILWSASWSFDDKYIAVGGDDGKLIIYETDQFKIYKQYTWDSAAITKVQWHPRRNVLALCGYSYKAVPDARLDQIIDLQTGKKIQLDTIGSRGMDWNHSGSALALADLEGGIHIYSVEGKSILSFPSGNRRSLTGISWHPDDSLLAVIGDDIRLMDTTGKLIRQINHSENSKLLLSVDWHPSGKFFATADYGHENEPTYVKYWSAEGSLLKTIAGSKKEIRHIQWDQQGTYLITASEALRFIDTAGVIQHTYPYEENLLWGLDLNRDQSKILVSGTANLIQIIDRDGKVILTIYR